MTPIYLNHGRLRSALGADLPTASQQYLAGHRPVPQFQPLLEINEGRPYFSALGDTGQTLQQTLEQMVRDGLGEAPDGLDDCLLILASTTLDLGPLEQQLNAGAPFGPELSSPLDHLAAGLRQRFGFADAYTLNTACTSAANALLYGARLVASGLYRRALVLAFETPCALALQGFGALGLLSPSGDYRPFHPERDGLVLGEAYASVLLSREPSPSSLGRLLGGFSACDTSSLTTTLEDGSHIDQVMQRALIAAGVAREQIALIKLHGTATGANDVAEANGMRRLFGEQLPPAVLLKPALGHTLGACGLSESLLLLQALRQGPLPTVDYAAEALLPLPATPIPVAPEALLLSNFFGFGGNNASLIVQGMPA